MKILEELYFDKNKFESLLQNYWIKFINFLKKEEIQRLSEMIEDQEKKEIKKDENFNLRIEESEKKIKR